MVGAIYNPLPILLILVLTLPPDIELLYPWASGSVGAGTKKCGWTKYANLF
jgi:hypothetical protein